MHASCFYAESDVPSTSKSVAYVPPSTRSAPVNNLTTAGPLAGLSLSLSQPVVVVYKPKINCPESRRYSSKAARLVNEEKRLSRPAESKVEVPEKKRLTKRHARKFMMFH
jgi:hypothetical protein